MPGSVPGRPVIELEHGITVYPARFDGDRWRAVWYEGGERRQCEAVSEDRLAGKLEKVTERLAAGAPHMRWPGADLIAWYLYPGRLPAERRWSRRHADTQRRLCSRFAVPVIGAVTCQDIVVAHTQAIVNAAPTAGEGERVRRMISALVSAGLDGDYLASPRLAKVHWQADGRPVPAPLVSVAGDRRCGLIPPRSRLTTTSPGSGGRSAPGCAARGMSSWPRRPPTAGCGGAS